MRKSLRIRLTLSFVILAIVPLLIIGAVTSFRTFTVQEQQAIALQQEVVQRVTIQVENFIFSREEELQLLIDIQGFSGLDAEQQRGLMRNLLQKQNVFAAIILIDKDGQTTHFESSTTISSGVESDRGYYSFDLNSLRFLVFDANFDRNGNDHFFIAGGDWQQPYVPPEELEWIKDQLASSPYPCVVFIHHPLYAYVKNGHTYHLANHMKVRAALEASGKVLAVINGHMHEEMFHEINDIKYLAMNSMLEGTFIQRNCFYTLELHPDRIWIDRYERVNKLD